MVFLRTLKPFARLRAAIAALLPVALLSSQVASADSPPPSYATGEESIHGSIASFSGAHTLYVHDDRGWIDHVTLRDGTVINPTGLHLHEGEPVTIYGTAHGSTFVADEIDTPYHRDSSVPYPEPYGDPYPAYGDPYAYPVYPYPVYPYPGYGYGYPYGLRIGVRVR